MAMSGPLGPLMDTADVVAERFGDTRRPDPGVHRQMEAVLDAVDGSLCEVQKALKLLRSGRASPIAAAVATT